jgi:predicted DNA-binding protein
MMGERYHRSQILLEPEQHDRMRHIATREGRSISDVARQAIEIGLEAMSQDDQELAKRRTLALDHLHAIRESVQTRYGVYKGDLIAEVRSDRNRELEPVRRSSE